MEQRPVAAVVQRIGQHIRRVERPMQIVLTHILSLPEYLARIVAEKRPVEQAQTRGYRPFGTHRKNILDIS
jgi:hypothetical protein